MELIYVLNVCMLLRSVDVSSCVERLSIFCTGFILVFNTVVLGAKHKSHPHPHPHPHPHMSTPVTPPHPTAHCIISSISPDVITYTHRISCHKSNRIGMSAKHVQQQQHTCTASNSIKSVTYTYTATLRCAPSMCDLVCFVFAAPAPDPYACLSMCVDVVFRPLRSAPLCPGLLVVFCAFHSSSCSCWLLGIDTRDSTRQ